MITVSTEKGLVSLETWDDVVLRPGFMKDVDPKTVKLERIIGTYQFEDEVVCGLSSCHHKHRRGYLIAIAGNRETNIGKDCGRTHFAVDFIVMGRQFDKAVRRMQRIEMVSATKHGLPELERRLSALTKGAYGADWIVKKIAVLNGLGDLPDAMIDGIRRMIQRQDNKISITRKASSEEVAVHEEMTRRRAERPHYIETVVGRFDGLAALYPENNLRTLVVEGLKETFRDLKEADLAAASDTALQKLAKRVEKIERYFVDIELIIAEAHRLLRRANIMKLEHFATGGCDVRPLRQFAAELPEDFPDDHSVGVAA